MVPTPLIQLIALWLLLAYPQAAAPSPQVHARVQTRSPHGKLDVPCQNCHTFSGWKPIRSVPEFDHSKTRYPLRGMHVSVSCTQCHTKAVFTNVGNKCADCHADLHRGQMGAACDSCHTVKGWLVSMQAIQQHQNRFPLVGAHSVAQCADCHKGAATGRFEGLSTECVTCHLKDYQQTTTPNHAALRFPTDCQACHRSLDTWLGASFDHRLAGFALTGMHATLDCNSCHVGGRFQGTPADCVGCHAKDYTNAKNPNHVQANFPQSCAMCHSTSGWSPASFDHAAVTGYALTGAHNKLVCTQCHTNGNYSNISTACSSCHQQDYNNTTNPNHASAGFPQSCQVCHTTTAWTPASFNHGTTGFPLTGAHTSLNCSSCHVNNQYSGLSPNCVSCHQKDYNNTSNPNHASAGFPTSCQSCHNTTSWAGATFNHSTTGFALTGAHTSTPCASCHVNNQYAGTPKDCYSCHKPAYQGTTNPNHVSAGFPTDCSLCHTTSTWAGATFNHSTTGFPLTGAHTSLNCSSCHVNNQYSGLSPNCVSCHQKDYNNTSNPNHASAGFPTSCQVCHSTTSWAGATFNHSTTGFALTGAHTSTPCASCHVNNQYAGTPTDCYSCHKSAYQSTTNPNHIAAGFPTTCNTCHNTTTWSGATFSHTWFPIYSGKHAGKWTSCGDCHTNPSNYAVFSCLTCHAHDKATADAQHREVRNYVYNSANCYSCHPTGNAN